MRMFGRRRVLSAEEIAANAERRAARAKVAMHCQCCGRAILANTGYIAHHGYERPGHGWQTSSCFGARRLPWEADRTALGEMIVFLKKRLNGLKKHLANVNAELVELTFTYRTYEKGSFGQSTDHSRAVSRKTFDEVRKELEEHFRKKSVRSFDELKSREISSTNYQIKGVKDHIKEAQKRFDGWKATHEWSDKKWRQL